MKFDKKIFKSLDLNKIIKADIFWLNHNFLGKDKYFKKRLLERWYREFVYSVYSIPENQKVDILFFRFMVRSDYKFFFEDIAKQFSGKKTLVQDYKAASDQLNLEASKWLSDVSDLLPDIGLDCYLATACIKVRLAMYLFELKKVLSNEFCSIVFFADMQPVENLIAQYCKKIGIKTVTMQHGLYVEYDQLDTINRINYEHVVSDYFLAWGENTCRLISKYNKNVKLIICGKPELQMSNSPSLSEESGYILAVLDQRIFDDENIAMLKILFEYSNKKNIPLRVKFHPSNNKKSYGELFPNLVEGGNIDNAKIVVGHTTSLIYEAMRIGSYVAKFQSNVPSIRLNSSLEFDSLQKFESIIELASQEIADGTEFIKFIGDDSRLQYRKFFDSIVKK